MFIRTTLSLLLLCCFINGYAQDYEDLVDNDKYQPGFVTRRIPAGLKENAAAVFRKSETIVDIKAPDEVYTTNRWVVTILTEEGLDEAKLVESYSKQLQIESISGRLFDSTGKEVERMKSTKVDDLGYGSSDHFFDDIRHKTFSFKYHTLPMTCYFEVVKKSKSAFNMPDWVPQQRHKYAVESASLIVNCPDNMGLRYRTYNLDTLPVTRHDNGQTTLVAYQHNKPAFKAPDGYSAVQAGNLPGISIEVNKVSLGGFAGDMSSWKSFGSFLYAVNENRDNLPAETKGTVHKLTDTCTSVYSKVNILYRHLQQTTRYVLITLGIGGYQTMLAETVATKGYGDCKALSNYMRALLKEAGVASNLVVIWGGNDRHFEMAADYPSSVFNHMILCVPNAKDTIWLECTAKELPAGYLSYNTGNRYCLVLSADGGSMVRTPTYNKVHNRMVRKATMTVDEQDQWKGNIDMMYSGFWWDKESHVLTEDRDGVTRMLNKEFRLSTYNVDQYALASGSSNGVPNLTESVSITGAGNITHAGQRLFITPKVLSYRTDPLATETRTDSFKLVQDFEVTDTTVVMLPAAYSAEKLGSELNYDWAFGSYHSKVYLASEKELKIVVTYFSKAGVYDPALFTEFAKLRRILNNGTAYDKIVLLKKG